MAGATAPGLVAAIRAAREGLRVALVAAGGRVGGCLPALGAVETHYLGARAPLLQEFVDQIKAHYRDRYGADSEQCRVCAGGGMVVFEPHVAEGILAAWIAAEPGIRLLAGYVPASCEKTGETITAATFRSVETGESLRLTARVFIEAGYEGDLMARAGASYRIGRESRDDFGEPSAGRIFTRWVTGRFPRAAAEGRLNLTTAGATTSEPLAASTGEGDRNIQSYSYRLCLTDDPANRRLLSVPPAGYRREAFAPILLPPEEKEGLRLPFHHRFLIYSLREMAERDHLFHGHALPNRKRSWNAANLTGGGAEYPEAGESARRAIARRHLDHALGLMWFLQNDPEMPADLRMRAREWGLARDEFVDNDNLPPQLYVREARRLAGRKVFTERDALEAPGLGRAPIAADSIAITEFSLDSLACTPERLPGALCDGQLFQMEVSRPGQVPFGALLPREIDNLLVVTTVSATHVGWGTVRQTPTLMHLAESAAWAAVLAMKKGGDPAHLDVVQLQQVLVEHGVMISFFNDADMNSPWARDVQWLGSQGFFATYDAQPEQPLREKVAAEWAAAAKAAIAPGEVAARVARAERSPGNVMPGPGGEALLRGEACRRYLPRRLEQRNQKG